MRKKKSGKKGNEIARKGAHGTPMGGDTPKPPPGKSSKGRRFEGKHLKELRPMSPPSKATVLRTKKNPRLKTSGPKKEGKHLKERVPAGALRAIKRKVTGGAIDPKKKKKTESHCEAYAEAYVRGVEQALYESSPIPPSAVTIDANAVNSLNSVIAEYNALIAQGADPNFALASAGTPNGMVNIGGYSIPLTSFIDPLSPRGTIRFINLRQFIGSALSEIGINLSNMVFNDPMALRPFRPGENFTGRRRPVSQFGPPAKPAPKQDPRMNVKAPPPMRPGPAG